MKKNIFVVGLSLLLLTGCSSDKTDDFATSKTSLAGETYEAVCTTVEKDVTASTGEKYDLYTKIYFSTIDNGVSTVTEISYYSEDEDFITTAYDSLNEKYNADNYSDMADEVLGFGVKVGKTDNRAYAYGTDYSVAGDSVDDAVEVYSQSMECTK